MSDEDQEITPPTPFAFALGVIGLVVLALGIVAFGRAPASYYWGAFMLVVVIVMIILYVRARSSASRTATEVVHLEFPDQATPVVKEHEVLREREIIREIVKIRCGHCGNLRSGPR
jgi:prepilin signal peptidase PulO-like enzyme (type II secretory pathway)